METPPESIINTSYGEVVITKHKQTIQPLKSAGGATVGSVSTLSLYGSSTSTAASEIDPWIQADPWGSYQKPKTFAPATLANDGIQQLEDRIHNAVLAKLPTGMEDNTTERLTALEGQVYQLMHRNQNLECQFNDFSAHSTQQFAVVQNQIQQQSSQFHGQFES